MAKSELDAMSKENRKYRIESAARTLMEAEKIKRDKKLLKAAREELKRQQKELSAALKKTGL